MESGSTVVNLMARMASSGRKDDEELQADLEQYVRQNLKRSEILHFVNEIFQSTPGALRHLTADFDNLE